MPNIFSDEELDEFIEVIWGIFTTPYNSKEENDAIRRLVPKIPKIVGFIKSKKKSKRKKYVY